MSPRLLRRTPAALLALLGILVSLAAGCSTSRKLPPQPPLEAGPQDGMLRFPDGQRADVWIPSGDGFNLGGLTLEGELCGGGQVAEGSGLVLQGQLGHAFDTSAASGGGVSLQWNSALLP